MANNENEIDSDDIKQQEIDELKNIVIELKIMVEDMKPKVERADNVLFSDDHDVDTRKGIDDIRLMRDIYRRFKSARFIFGAIAGVLTFLATGGWAIYKLTELFLTLFKTKGGG